MSTIVDIRRLRVKEIGFGYADPIKLAEVQV